MDHTNQPLSLSQTGGGGNCRRTPTDGARHRDGDLRTITALSAAHFNCDAYLSFLPPLWPVFKTVYGLNNTAIGMLAGLLSLIANFGQLIFGYITDRLHMPRLVLIAVLVTAISVSTIGLVSSLGWAVGMIIFAGIGVALFHPRAAALATTWREDQRAFGLSIFGTAGTLGIAAGSMAGVALYQYWGSLRGLLPAVVMGLGIGLFVAIVNPERDSSKAAQQFHLRQHLLPRLSQLMPVLMVIIFRTTTLTAFNNFVPVLVSIKGASLTMGGFTVFVLIAGTALGALTGGRLALWVNERVLTAATLMAAGPFLLLAVASSGTLVLLALFVGGFLARCAEYVNIAQAQEIMPEGANTAAALAIGASWGVAGAVSPLVGYLGDSFGVAGALYAMTILPAAGALLAWFHPAMAIAKRERTP